LETLKEVCITAIKNQISLDNFIEICGDIPFFHKNDDLKEVVAKFLDKNNYSLKKDEDNFEKFIEKYTEYANEILLDRMKTYEEEREFYSSPDEYSSSDYYE
jgi:hypothetical protein